MIKVRALTRGRARRALVAIALPALLVGGLAACTPTAQPDGTLIMGFNCDGTWNGAPTHYHYTLHYRTSVVSTGFGGVQIQSLLGWNVTGLQAGQDAQLFLQNGNGGMDLVSDRTLKDPSYTIGGTTAPGQVWAENAVVSSSNQYEFHAKIGPNYTALCTHVTAPWTAQG
jgi:hypothetical protein